MKKLPIGIQTFREIIDDGHVYADKTRYIYNLLSSAKYNFLSRPRRFGKSLLLDTISEVFNGERELFKGLWIYDAGYDFKKHPVIRLDLTKVLTEDAESLKHSFSSRLIEYMEAEDIPAKPDPPSEQFQRLILALYKKYGERVVVLIDEYDKPILDHITDAAAANANRQVLKSFFGVLKGMDAYLRFTFFTGVSKFTKTSLFSELNNLRDITLSQDYANICGFTEEDFDMLFTEHLTDMEQSDNYAALPKEGEDSLRKQIFRWYDGYSWDGKTRVFNPFSLLNFFSDKRFSAYWFSSGSPSFLIQLIKLNPGLYQNVADTVVNELSLDVVDIENIAPISLMFQTGYLTVNSITQEIGESAYYCLKIPNKEVRDAFNHYILMGFTETDTNTAQAAQRQMLETLRAGKPEQLEKILRGLFASIPYEIHVDAEAYYQSIFYAIMQVLGFKIEAEVSVSGGRINGVLELPATAEGCPKVYVIEFKYCQMKAKKPTKGKINAVLEKALSDAVKQINARGYCDRYAAAAYKGYEIYKTALAVTGRSEVRVRYEKM